MIMRTVSRLTTSAFSRIRMAAGKGMGTEGSRASRSRYRMPRAVTMRCLSTWREGRGGSGWLHAACPPGEVGVLRSPPWGPPTAGVGVWVQRGMNNQDSKNRVRQQGPPPPACRCPGRRRGAMGGAQTRARPPAEAQGSGFLRSNHPGRGAGLKHSHNARACRNQEAASLSGSTQLTNGPATSPRSDPHSLSGCRFNSA